MLTNNFEFFCFSYRCIKIAIVHDMAEGIIIFFLMVLWIMTEKIQICDILFLIFYYTYIREIYGDLFPSGNLWENDSISYVEFVMIYLCSYIGFLLLGFSQLLCTP